MKKGHCTFGIHRSGNRTCLVIPVRTGRTTGLVSDPRWSYRRAEIQAEGLRHAQSAWWYLVLGMWKRLRARVCDDRLPIDLSPFLGVTVCANHALGGQPTRLACKTQSNGPCSICEPNDLPQDLSILKH